MASFIRSTYQSSHKRLTKLKKNRYLFSAYCICSISKVNQLNILLNMDISKKSNHTPAEKKKIPHMPNLHNHRHHTVFQVRFSQCHRHLKSKSPAMEGADQSLQLQVEAIFQDIVWAQETKILLTVTAHYNGSFLDKPIGSNTQLDSLC